MAMRGRKGIIGNKKGSIVDLIFLAVGLVAFAIAILITFKLTSEFNTNIQADTNIPTEAKTSSTQLLSNYGGIIDHSALFLLIGIALCSLVLASLVRVHPIFIPFFLIALVFIIFICGVFSNVYQEMAANPNLSAQANELVFITYILTYLPFLVGVIGIILMIIMYKIWSNAQE